MRTKQTNSLVLLLLMAVLGSYSIAYGEGASGSWTKKEQAISGGWNIEARDDGHYLVLSEEFRTRKAPDLKFVLSHQGVGEVSSKTAMVEGLVISPLKSNKGQQSYRLPANYGDYATLLLHCEQYSKLWGATSLK